MQSNIQTTQHATSKTTIVLVILAVIAGLYLLTQHGQHIFPYLPFTFLLGCLFMHLFMHGSHSGHGGGDHEGEDKQNDEHAGHQH